MIGTFQKIKIKYNFGLYLLLKKNKEKAVNIKVVTSSKKEKKSQMYKIEKTKVLSILIQMLKLGTKLKASSSKVEVKSLSIHNQLYNLPSPYRVLASLLFIDCKPQPLKILLTIIPLQIKKSFSCRKFLVTNLLSKFLCTLFKCIQF